MHDTETGRWQTLWHKWTLSCLVSSFDVWCLVDMLTFGRQFDVVMWYWLDLSAQFPLPWRQHFLWLPLSTRGYDLLFKICNAMGAATPDSLWSVRSHLHMSAETLRLPGTWLDVVSSWRESPLGLKNDATVSLWSYGAVTSQPSCPVGSVLTTVYYPQQIMSMCGTTQYTTQNLHM